MKIFLYLKNYKIILILIIFLAAFLRIISLNKIPVAFNHDELLSTYESYSILTTGCDQWSNLLPLRFKAFGDYPPPLYFYFNVPFVLIFGLNEWVVRLPAAILGILTVWFVFLLVKELFENKTIGLLAAFLTAISPWHLHYSRMGWPAIMVPFLITLGLWLFFSGLNHQKKHRIYLAIIFISLSAWTYTPAQVFVPLLLFGLFIFYRKRVEKKVILYSLLIAFIFLFPLYLLSLIIHPEWQTRFNQISVFRLINSEISLQSDIYSNLKIKGVFWLVVLFFYNYLAHLSPFFLFIVGDVNLRHSIKGMGHLYLFELVFWTYLIIYFLIKEKKERLYPPTNFLFYWFLIFPIASSLTLENTPHASRTIVALPVVHIFSALSIFLFISSLNKVGFKIIFSLAIVILSITIFFSFFVFSINYYRDYPKYSAPWFNYGDKELAEYIKENYEKYEKIIISRGGRNIYLSLLFYLPYEPKKFHNSQPKIDETNKMVLLLESFDKFNFVFSFEKIKEGDFSDKTLYIGSYGEELPLPTKKIIYFPNGSIAYRIMALD